MNQGTLKERYEIYRECMISLGLEYLTFDQWLNT